MQKTFMEENKPNKPYHGVWVVALFMAGMPALLFLILHAVITRFESAAPAMITAESLVLAGGLGSLFCLIFFLCGGLQAPFAVVRERVANFFSNAGISLKSAIVWHLQDMWHDGVVFWIYLVLFGGNLAVLICGLKQFFSLWP